MADYFEKQADGSYTPVDEPTRIKEFRDRNVALMKQYEGVDVEEYQRLKAAGTTDPDAVVALKLALATEKGKAAAAEAATVALTRRHAVSAAFLAAGGQPSAVDLILIKAPADITTLDEWLKEAAIGEELGFAFKASKGGGASGSKPAVLGAHSNVRVLRNPSPQELGAAAADIKAGKVRVEITT